MSKKSKWRQRCTENRRKYWGRECQICGPRWREIGSRSNYYCPRSELCVRCYMYMYTAIQRGVTWMGARRALLQLWSDRLDHAGASRRKSARKAG